MFKDIINNLLDIKLLKDVFEALSSHTPCLFLLEDIHHIGGRRPLLFSDQAAMPPEESGYDKQAPLDEKNQRLRVVAAV